MKIKLYDTTLRDGAQAAGISFSVEDKIKITQALDRFGIDYIEGGWPGSNPKDEEYFMQIKKVKLYHAEVVAFGATRRKDTKVHTDTNLLSILHTGTPTVCIFGKSWDFHVIHALHTTLSENIRMISESIAFLRQKGRKVIYDAEHFFDGFKANKTYALKTLESAIHAGAHNITLCDTNGGTLPDEIREIIRAVQKYLKLTHLTSSVSGRSNRLTLGIHTHNDADCAVANTIIGVQEGCTLIQGTINGYGERCGNANLCSVIPALQLKLGYRILPKDNLHFLTELSRYINEVANVLPNERQPYVGQNAFAHKGGVHISAVTKHSATYEHISPADVGNERKILLSELSGKSSIIPKISQYKINKKNIPKVIDLLKKKEYLGYQYEDANASFMLAVHKELGKYKPCFELKGFKVIVEKNPSTGEMSSEATIKLQVNGKEEHTAAEGRGPVNALDNALRKALHKFYPKLKEVSLTDFKVRVINAEAGTAAKVRVLIELSDHKTTWGTIGVSENIIEASWQALVDGIEYKLLRGDKDA